VTSPVLIGQLTDLHVVDPDGDTELYVDNNGRLAEAVASIESEAPTLDVVVVTGDLVNDEGPDEYEALAELLAPLSTRLVAVPGNHDDRALLRATLPDVGWGDHEHLSWVTDVRGVRIVGLDSTRRNEHGGELDDERAEWLDAALRASDGPTIIAMHHPPFDTGITWMDDEGYPGRETFAEIVSDSSVVKIICGHRHRPMASTVGGVPCAVGMSTVHHMGLALTPDAPIEVIRDPGGYQVHRVVGPDVVTHHRYIATGEQAFVPSWAMDPSN